MEKVKNVNLKKPDNKNFYAFFISDKKDYEYTLAKWQFKVLEKGFEGAIKDLISEGFEGYQYNDILFVFEKADEYALCDRFVFLFSNQLDDTASKILSQYFIDAYFIININEFV